MRFAIKKKNTFFLVTSHGFLATEKKIESEKKNMRKYEGGNPDLSTNLFKPSFAVGLLFQLAIHVPVLVLGPGQLSLHVLEALLVVLMVLRNLCGGCLTFFHFFHFALCNFQLAFVVRLQFLAL